MDEEDDLVRNRIRIDEDIRVRRRKRAASILELYVYFIVAFVLFGAEYYRASPVRSPEEIFNLVLQPKIVVIAGVIFFALFTFFLTSFSPLVNLVGSSSALTKVIESISIGSDGVLIKTSDYLARMLVPDREAVRSIEAVREATFDQAAQEYLARSANTARTAKGRPNALLFVGTTIAGLGLIFFVLTLPGAQLGIQPITDVNSDHLWASMLNLLPRLLMLIFIQVLAGFFLRQYRSSMEEFRYYEAVLRYRETQYLSYLLRKATNDKESLIKFADEILKEKNFGRLLKGESTAVIEAHKSEINEFSSFIEKLLDRLKKSEMSKRSEQP